MLECQYLRYLTESSQFTFFVFDIRAPFETSWSETVSCMSVIIGCNLPPSCLGPWFDFLRNDTMKHDLCILTWLVLLKSLAPVVAAGVGEDGTLSVECCSCDGLTCAWITLESMLGQSVPEVECAVATSC